MADKAKKPSLPQVQWKEVKRVLTLEKRPVLEMNLSWPQIVGGGRGGERISRYYFRLAQAWQTRWGRETYWQACLDFAQAQEQSRLFHPWTAQLSGAVLFQDGETLSLRMDAWEIHGDGKPIQVRTGDIWKLPEGVPLPVGSYFPGRRRWRHHLIPMLQEQGERRREAGDCFLDADFSKKLHWVISPGRCSRTAEGLEFYAPQGVLAPAAEGVVTFTFSWESR